MSRLRPLILLLDDIASDRAPVKDILELSGYRVAEASTMIEARHIMVTERPSLAILDIRLEEKKMPPDTSGLKFATELAADFPVIFRSSHPDLNNVRAAFANTGAKVVTFLSKEEDLEALLANVKMALTNRPRQTPLWQRILVFCLVATILGLIARFFSERVAVEIIVAVGGAIVFEILMWLLRGSPPG